MLGRVQAGRPGPVTFAELEEPVRGLLRDFGLPPASYHLKFPLHHLTSDGLWTITDAADATDATGADAGPLDTSVTKLRRRSDGPAGADLRGRADRRPHRPGARREAKLAVFDYLETFNNPRRCHSALGQIAPTTFEAQHTATTAA
ncbi:hypothetical protein Gobs01_03677 [Geodermatophilus obscurus DSM 43160]|nr:hypothetical protein [Geodermatophilus obscurus]